jgi:hypothetical protein
MTGEPGIYHDLVWMSFGGLESSDAFSSSSLGRQKSLEDLASIHQSDTVLGSVDTVKTKLAKFYGK